MKTKLLAFLFIGLLSLTSCSKEDKDKPVPPPDTKKSELAGTWQINEIRFTKFVEKGFPANDAVMQASMVGYDFKENGDFVYIAVEGSPFNDSDAKYWRWESDSTKKSFKIIQLNIAKPPYNFGITVDTYNISKEDGKDVLKFSTELGNKSEATFKLTKGNVDKKIKPKVYMPDGKAYAK